MPVPAFGELILHLLSLSRSLVIRCLYFLIALAIDKLSLLYSLLFDSMISLENPSLLRSLLNKIAVLLILNLYPHGYSFHWMLSGWLQ